MSAVISPCGMYRYRLEREIAPSLLSNEAWQQARTLGIIMVNPSTADAVADDATIRKVVGFASRLGYARVIVGNKFAYRSTDIRGLRIATEPVGPDNSAYLAGIMQEADFVLVAWGPLGKLPRNLRNRWRAVAEIARNMQCDLHALAITKDGQPGHPLMLGYDCKPVPWSAYATPTDARHAGLAGDRS